MILVEFDVFTISFLMEKTLLSCILGSLVFIINACQLH